MKGFYYLGFFWTVCSAIYLFREKSVNKAYQVVNLKNKKIFQHPAEAMDYTVTTEDIPWNVKRKSSEKRPNELYYNLGEDREVDDSNTDDEQQGIENVGFEARESEDEGIEGGGIEDGGIENEGIEDEGIEDGGIDDLGIEDGGVDTEIRNHDEFRDNVERANVDGISVNASSQVQSEGFTRSTGLYGRSCKSMERYINLRARIRPEYKIPTPSSILCSGI
jgi:hypothetical protein